MKIVINDCFGGFSLSWAAIKRYAELKGFKVYRFEYNYSNNSDTPIGDDEPDRLMQHYRKGIDESGDYFHDRDVPRDDKDLIKVVEELGDAASGRLSSLKIVEIPDDVDWKIDEYDGNEHVAEKHRTWG